MSTDRSRRFRKGFGAAALAALLPLTACAGSDADSASPPPSSITQAAAHTDQQHLSLTIPGTLAAGFAEWQAGMRGRAGMAVMPVGGDKMVTFGDWTTGPAWSTMKIPLTVAALRRGTVNTTYAATAAITQSDNAAADTLWQSLGSSQEAAKAVEAVLREGGDTKTTVPSAKPRADVSAFGQADWALTEQVRFASRLPCLSQTGNVISLMEQITPNQRWGLGAFTGAEFKGGWGPDASGQYLVRQFGLVPTAGGQIAIAFAVQPDSGAFSDGMTALDKLATLVSQHLDELSGGACS
ncbi:hypothetical protein ACLMAJ_16280 [Nocardia sp. KC 131]|uniref:hypothetical protein n=1 Tax=Nocardia arseniciresistens TaxID=3392119 RepID=UPI00398F6F54